MNSENRPAGPQTQLIPTPDSVYYFIIVVFRAGNTLFRVPKHGFNVPGTPFEAIFVLPQGFDTKVDDAGATPCEGISDDNPIVLHQVEEDDFCAFLKVLYPLDPDLCIDDWIRALRLAIMWGFKDIRAKAIQALDMYARTQNAALTVLLAKKYNVVYWLRNGYTRLVNEHLDRETKCKIYYAKSSRNRDYIKSINDSPYQCSSGYLHLVDESCPHFKIRPALFDEVFGDELKVMGRSTRELVLTHRSTFLSDIDHASHISNCSVFCNREPIHAKMVNRCGEKISVRPMR